METALRKNKNLHKIAASLNLPLGDWILRPTELSP
jgi:hypothetical protein